MPRLFVCLRYLGTDTSEHFMDNFAICKAKMQREKKNNY
ncbi:hypothetical protein HMPREF1152_0031 [Mogibacterium sp. CM50]|nr:hypothetical protein HMPREF1152_0031 [Mogibacterium sp. CM50]